MIILVVLFVGLAAPSKQAVQSPCPSVLVYEERSAEVPDRWYGQLILPAENPHWLFITIILNNRAALLGNWLGEVTTQDNTAFRINNPEIKTRREPIRFFVKHDPEDLEPPTVQLIKLDGTEICNADKPVAAEVQNIQNTAQDSSSEQGQCGRVKMDIPVALVVNGAPTHEGQWPWQAAIYMTQGVNQNYICGGTLVSHRHVITAAHCTTVKNSKPAQKVDDSTLTVFLGKHDLITSVIGVQIKLVEKITIRPEYESQTFRQDVSILLLQEPVQYSSWVQPACLWPDQLVDLSHVVDKNGSVVGWGNDGSGKLQLAQMPVVSQETCLRSSKGEFYRRITTNYTFCAGEKNGQSTCRGDSGSGMVFLLNGAWHLRGLVSVAILKTNEAVCDPQHFVVFTDLAKLLPWIRENIEPY